MSTSCRFCPVKTTRRSGCGRQEQNTRRGPLHASMVSLEEQPIDSATGSDDQQAAPETTRSQPRAYADLIDDTLDDSFPASDPPQWWVDRNTRFTRTRQLFRR